MTAEPFPPLDELDYRIDQLHDAVARTKSSGNAVNQALGSFQTLLLATYPNASDELLSSLAEVYATGADMGVNVIDVENEKEKLRTTAALLRLALE